MWRGGHGGTRSELDSHATMTVAGEQAYVSSKSGLDANVRAFSAEASWMQGVPIVDCMWVYDCAYSGLTYMLVAKNTHSVPSSINVSQSLSSLYFARSGLGCE